MSDELLKEVLDRVLAQNDRLIEALTQSSPVEIVRALNPPVAAAEYKEPWRVDPGPERVPEDPWGDPTVPFEKLRVDGWVDPPFASAVETIQADDPLPELYIEEVPDATATATE